MAAYPIKETRRFNTIRSRIRQIQIVHTEQRPQGTRRGQQADGTNVFVLKPGLVITYDRNPRTNQALRAEGINLEVIEIEGSELVRGLGGPRCMTMPLEREGAARSRT